MSYTCQPRRRRPSRAESVRDRGAEQGRVVTLAQHGWQPASHRTARVAAVPYDADVRAVVLDDDGQPRLGDAPAPSGESMRVLACGLCGSDVEKLGRAPAGTVLGHEVVARRADGARVALVHHLPCGECERCRAGHESTCERFAAPTIVPGGFAERSRRPTGRRAAGRGSTTRPAPTSSRSRACSAERSACRAARVLVVGQGFVGRLFAAVLRGGATTSSRRRRTRSAPAARPTARSTPPCSARPRPRSTPWRRAARCSSFAAPRRSTSTRSTAAS